MPVAAAVFGHLAQRDIRRSSGRLGGGGLALGGLILGYAGFVVGLPVILIVAAIAIPNLLRARVVANEASAAGSLRTLSVAIAAYDSTYGSFPASLEVLGPPPAGAPPSKNAAGLVDSTLAAGSRHGYVFLYEPYDSVGDGRLDAYTLHANPIEPNRSGRFYFFIDESGIIRSDREPASARSPPLQ